MPSSVGYGARLGCQGSVFQRESLKPPSLQDASAARNRSCANMREHCLCHGLGWDFEGASAGRCWGAWGTHSPLMSPEGCWLGAGQTEAEPGGCPCSGRSSPGLGSPSAGSTAGRRHPLQEPFLLPHVGAYGETRITRCFSCTKAEKAASAFEGALSAGRGAADCQLLCFLIQRQVAGAEAACGVSKILYFTFDILFRSIWIP